MYHTSKTSQYSRMGTWTVIVCLHYLRQCTVCSKWHRNAIIHSCHSALPSIRLMTFFNRPGFPWLLKSRMWEVGESGDACCLIGEPWSNSSVWTHLSHGDLEQWSPQPLGCCFLGFNQQTKCRKWWAKKKKQDNSVAYILTLGDKKVSTPSIVLIQYRYLHLYRYHPYLDWSAHLWH